MKTFMTVIAIALPLISFGVATTATMSPAVAASTNGRGGGDNGGGGGGKGGDGEVKLGLYCPPTIGCPSTDIPREPPHRIPPRVRYVQHESCDRVRVINEWGYIEYRCAMRPTDTLF